MILQILKDDNPINPRKDCDWLGTIVHWSSRYNIGDEQIDDINFHLCELIYPDDDAYLKLDGIADANLIEPYSNEMLTLLRERIERKGYVILPIYMYDHSGITIKTTPFSCRWDSGLIAFIYVNIEQLNEAGHNWQRITKKRRKKVEDWLRSEVYVYDMYLTGEVYGYRLLGDKGEEIDSCWGFYGSDWQVNGIKDNIHEGAFKDLKVIDPYNA